MIKNNFRGIQLMIYASRIVIILCFSLWFALCVGCSSNQSPSLNKAPNMRAASLNMQLGLAYLQQGDVPRARTKLLLAQKQAPEWPPALDAMAYLLEKTGDPEAAKIYYLRALKIAPQSAANHNNYGAFLCRQGYYQQALNEFSVAIADKNYNELAKAYENAGICASRIPNKQLAAEFFKKALLEDPKSEAALEGMNSAAIN